MQYNNEEIRRQDRLLDQLSATKLLQQGEYGILSMMAEKSGGYGIPFSYVWNGEGSIYLHCAYEGRKMKLIAQCNKVSFCVVGETRVIPDRFTTGYESIVLECTAVTGLSTEERLLALELLIDKYSPHHTEKGNKYIAQSFERTEIIRLNIQKWSGKSKPTPLPSLQSGPGYTT